MYNRCKLPLQPSVTAAYVYSGYMYIYILMPSLLGLHGRRNDASTQVTTTGLAHYCGLSKRTR